MHGAPCGPAVDQLDRGKLDDAVAEVRLQSRGFGVEDELAHAADWLLPVALDRRLDLFDRALDLVVGQVALYALAVGERERAIDFGLELAQPESLRDGRRRLVG